MSNDRIASTTIITLVLCGLVSVFLPGCGIIGASGNGDFQMIGTAEGVRAFMQGQNGLVQNGKEVPTDNSYWVSQRVHDREKTKQAYAPSFLQNLFGRGGK